MVLLKINYVNVCVRNPSINRYPSGLLCACADVQNHKYAHSMIWVLFSSHAGMCPVVGTHPSCSLSQNQHSEHIFFVMITTQAGQFENTRMRTNKQKHLFVMISDAQACLIEDILTYLYMYIHTKYVQVYVYTYNILTYVYQQVLYKHIHIHLFLMLCISNRCFCSASISISLFW
jgi:hypothetical protein